VEVIDKQNGDKRRLDCCAVFVFIGAEPYTRWLAGQVTLDDRGFVRTGTDAAGDPDAATGSGVDGRGGFVLETSRPGVFAAGDVRSGSTKRVASAVGEGSMAVRLVHDHLAGPGGDAHR
jgi:thioredoxin reductase (NADPH)